MNSFFLPPLEPDQVKEAYKMANEKLPELEEQVKRGVYDALDPFWDKPAKERLAFYSAHEPVRIIDPLTMQEVYSPYWQALSQIDPKETKAMIQDYAKLLKDTKT